MFNVVTVAEAKEIISEKWQVPEGCEAVPLTAALGRYLAGEVISSEDVPGFDRSTVDGFAVRAADTYGASEAMPAYLQVAGEVLMGGDASGVSLMPGQCLQVATGGMLPEGADAIVMLEQTEWLEGATVAVNRPVAPGENMVRQGEDVRAGQTLLAKGHRLRPPDIGLLAAIGMSSVQVYSPVSVGIISTGNEVVSPDRPVAPGQVRDINSYTLHALVQACGSRPRLYGIIPDRYEELLAVTRQAIAENDIVLLSGGSSVGTRDYTMKVMEALSDAGLLFHGISIRPGKPTVLAVAAGRLLVGLPGHPVSAMVIFDLLVRPLLTTGCFDREADQDPAVLARLTRNLASGTGREDHVRVRLLQKDGELWAEPVLGKSGLISTLVQAVGEVVIPLEQEGLGSGQKVAVRLLDR